MLLSRHTVVSRFASAKIRKNMIRQRKKGIDTPMCIFSSTLVRSLSVVAPTVLRLFNGFCRREAGVDTEGRRRGGVGGVVDNFFLLLWRYIEKIFVYLQSLPYMPEVGCIGCSIMIDSII